MNLSNIESLDLRVEENNKRKKLNEDLHIGESAFISNSLNKIKKTNDNEYMFMRFDYIKSHIEYYSSNYNLNDIYEHIVKNLDKDVKYADDRVQLVNQLLDENNWIYEIKSSSNIIAKEIKKKNSFLAENQRFDKLLDRISDYICFAKFKNEEDEKEYEDLKKQQEEIESLPKSNRKEHYDELDRIIDRIQKYPHEFIRRSLENSSKLDMSTSIDQHESFGNIISSEEQSIRNRRVKYTYKHNDYTDAYWNKMYKNRNNEIPFLDDTKLINGKEFRKQVMKQFKVDLDNLQKIIGLHLPKEERKEHIQNLINYLDKRRNEKIERICEGGKITKEKAKSIVFSGNRQYAILKRMYDNFKGDYELSKVLLSDEISFNVKNHYTDYSVIEDTWYEDENGEVVEISKNRVLLSEASTYRGLILNYRDLKDKYSDKFNHNIWALLRTFEDLLDKTLFTEDEKFVLDMIFDNHTQKQIRDKYEEKMIGTITTRRMSNLINNIIPNKLLQTYLNSVDDWLYTEKIKGEYKKCTSCGEIKLISNDRYFGKHPLSPDGFQPSCRKCDSFRK